MHSEANSTFSHVENANVGFPISEFQNSLNKMSLFSYSQRKRTTSEVKAESTNSEMPQRSKKEEERGVGSWIVLEINSTTETGFSVQFLQSQGTKPCLDRRPCL